MSTPETAAKTESKTVGQRCADRLFVMVDGEEQIKRYNRSTVEDIINEEAILSERTNQAAEEKERLGNETRVATVPSVSQETGLLPCPFCGSNNVGVPFEDLSEGHINRWITCYNCDCDGPTNLNKEPKIAEGIARIAWNRRFQTTPHTADHARNTGVRNPPLPHTGRTEPPEEAR